MAKARRMDFRLLAEDIEYLESLGLEWEAVEETVINDVVKAVVIYGYSLPARFSPQLVDMHVKIPKDYMSGAELDMFFTYPKVARTDGQMIDRYTDTAIFMQKIWQQWSRHRNTQPWRPGEDNIATHIAFMNMALKKESGEEC